MSQRKALLQLVFFRALPSLASFFNISTTFAYFEGSDSQNFSSLYEWEGTPNNVTKVKPAESLFPYNDRYTHVWSERKVRKGRFGKISRGCFCHSWKTGYLNILMNVLSKDKHSWAYLICKTSQRPKRYNQRNKVHNARCNKKNIRKGRKNLLMMTTNQELEAPSCRDVRKAWLVYEYGEHQDYL